MYLHYFSCWKQFWISTNLIFNQPYGMCWFLVSRVHCIYGTSYAFWSFLFPLDECSSVVDCDINAQCLYDSSSQRYKCVCNAGYEGDGRICTTSAGTYCVLSHLYLFSRVFEFLVLLILHYFPISWICWYISDTGCNIVNNCDVNANCIYDTYALNYRCQCHDGYEGDGFFCSPVQVFIIVKISYPISEELLHIFLLDFVLSFLYKLQ